MEICFQAFDETASYYYAENTAGKNITSIEGVEDSGTLQDATMKFAMNGLLYCNLKGLKMKIGER